MGHTRVVFTDATTAEGITVLKTLGYLETSEGGYFLNQRTPLRIYSVWGKARYYPDLLQQLQFTPRIQVHFKCDDDSPLLNETVQACLQGLLKLSENTRFKVYDINSGEEITPALLKK